MEFVYDGVGWVDGDGNYSSSAEWVVKRLTDAGHYQDPYTYKIVRKDIENGIRWNRVPLPRKVNGVLDEEG